MNALQIVDYLTYQNYRHNRKISPHISPERWEKVYGKQARVYEAKFRMEKPEVAK